MSSEEMFDVEAIRKKKFIKGKPHYLIKWTGYEEKENTWEPLQHLAGVDWMVEEFEMARKKRRTAQTPPFELPEMLKVDTSCQAWIPEIQDQYVGPCYEIIGQRTAVCILFQKGQCKKDAKCPFRHEKLPVTPAH